MKAGEDDLGRQVHCLLGVPVDIMPMQDVLARMIRAAGSREPFFFSTPNLNFIVQAQRDKPFRDSLIQSDACLADGVGVLALCKLLGIPLIERVPGSDIPARLDEYLTASNLGPYKIAIFGGDPGVARKASDIINAKAGSRLHCTGCVDPGLMTPARMDHAPDIAALNATRADFLLVSLGAAKGQAWIIKNRGKIDIPAISHLGATLNFIAGTVKRAPPLFQRRGMEWMWRIKEEPQLFSRYRDDAVSATTMLLNRVLPLSRWLRSRLRRHESTGLQIASSGGSVTLSGAATTTTIGPVIDWLRQHIDEDGKLELDLSALKVFDMRFAGLLLMLEKLSIRRQNPVQVQAGGEIARVLNLCGADRLLVTNRMPGRI